MVKKKQSTGRGKAKRRDLKPQRVRSPNYPAISLPDAVKRVEQLYEKDGRAGALSPRAIGDRHRNRRETGGRALLQIAEGILIWCK